MKEVNLMFQGYWVHCEHLQLPIEQGIYAAFRCKYNEANNSVTPLELLYIGKTNCFDNRLSHNERSEDFIGHCDKEAGECVCYSCAYIDAKDLDDVENAMIHAQEPLYKDCPKDDYNLNNPIAIHLSGVLACMKQVNFIVSKDTNTVTKIEKEKPIYPKWNESAERLLLYIDIMGFKSRINSKSHEKLLKELINFRDKWSKSLEQFRLGDNLCYTQFSDTILIVANGTDDKMFNLITKAACRFMHQALNEGYAVKGVMSQGQFYFDENNQLYFGKPLVDAYELYDAVKYYGIVVHHTAERTVKQFHSRKDPYTKTSIRLKDGEVSHYHLAWNLLNKKLSPDNFTPKCLEWLNKIEETVSGAPRIYIDNTRKVLLADSNLYNEEQKKFAKQAITKKKFQEKNMNDKES